MNKQEAIQHHQALVTKRKNCQHKLQAEISVEKNTQLIAELDKEIGRYGNAHNPKISQKAAQYIGH